MLLYCNKNNEEGTGRVIQYYHTVNYIQYFTYYLYSYILVVKNNIPPY